MLVVTGRKSLNNLFRPKIERLKSYGLLQENERSLGLTELGTFFADEVAHQFHHADHIPHPREAYADGPLNPYRETDPFLAESMVAAARVEAGTNAGHPVHEY
jgi:oxygen-independent coproporphyrinogen-3 oxidase